MKNTISARHLRGIIQQEIRNLHEQVPTPGGQTSAGDGVEVGAFKVFLVDLMKKNGADSVAIGNLSSAMGDIAKKDMKEITKALSTPELAALGKVFLALIETDDPAVITKAAALLKNAKQKK